MSAPTIPNLNSPHAIVLIGTDGLPYAATGGGAGGAAISAGASSQNSGTVIFSNAGGVSFGLNAGVMTASVAAAGGAQTGISSIADSANTQTVGMLSFSNAHGVSFGLSTGASTATLTASVAAQTAQTGISGVVVSNTTYTSGTVSFVNSNGISFGSSGANGISASYTVPSTAGLISGMRLSAGGGTSNTAVTGLTFSNSNGITFGLSTGASVGTLTASYNSTQFAGTGTTFAGANVSGSMTLNSAGLDLSLSAGAGGAGAALSNSQTYFSTGTINLLEGGGAITIASGTNQSFLFSVPQTSVLSGGANITVSTTNNNTITIIGASAAAAPLYVTGTNGSSVSAQTLAFGAANGLTLGLSTAASAATVTGSYTVPTQSVQTQASGNLAGIGTTTTTQAGSTLGATLSTNGLSLAIPPWITTATGGGGGIALANSQTTYTSGTAWISEGGGAITIGSTANGASQSFTIGVPATSSLVGANGVSVSTNGSTISIIGGSGIPYLSYFEPADRMGAAMVYSTIPNNASMYLTPFEVYQYLSAYRMMVIDSASTAASTLSASNAVSESAQSTTGSVSVGHSMTFALFSRQSSGTDAHSSNLVSFTSVSRTRGFQAAATSSVSTNGSTGTAHVTTAFSMSFIANIDSAGNYTTSSTSLSGSSSSSLTSTGAGTSSWSMSMTGQNVYVTGARVYDIPLAFSLAPGEYWFGLQYNSSSASTAFSHTGCISYAFAPAILTSNPTSIYNAGVLAASQNTTNVEQGAGSVSSALTTTTFGMTAVHQYNGWQTWFNMLADTL